MVRDVVPGGATRRQSVRSGLEAAPTGVDAIVCHDSARPFASPDLFARVTAGLGQAHGVVPVVSSPDTIKVVREGRVVETIPRDHSGLVQTPQAFHEEVLRSVHETEWPPDLEATDDAMLLELAGFQVAAVGGEVSNFKITTPEDLRRAAWVIAVGAKSEGQRWSPDEGNGVRVGLGFDSHPRGDGRVLYLGGVRFEDVPGLAGHSDGDVVCHAVADALLGAVGLGDLGEHFPDTDPAFEGMAGLDLLTRVVAMLLQHGVRPVACDLTVVAERPHLASRREEIKRNLGAALGVPPAAVSVKATRPEGLGLSGDGAGCLAVVTAMPISPAPA
jgi:2-C-methyl-D-erythritol 4-phosphate cytidylyltransferase/2-C-methyl-D-erythritol 2,4-cyclodiphosphate synthase